MQRIDSKIVLGAGILDPVSFQCIEKKKKRKSQMCGKDLQKATALTSYYDDAMKISDAHS